MTKKATLPPATAETVQSLLEACRLRHVAARLPETTQRAHQEDWTYLEVLHDLFQAESTRRRNARFQRNLKASGLSIQYAIENFDFDLAKAHGVKPRLVRELAGCDFIRQNRNIILAGPSGTGKSYLARTLGVEALRRGHTVAFRVTSKLVNELYEKRNSFTFGKVFSRYLRVELLLLDDLAYLPFSPEKVEYLFSLVIDRYEAGRGATIVTTNTDVTEWWRFFPSKPMGVAFSDRLLDRAHGIRFSGPSIRPNRPAKPKRSR